MPNKNSYGFLLEELANNPVECQRYLSRYLNNGYLGLLLGAGASKALELPSWYELVLSIAQEIVPGDLIVGKDYSNTDLKKLTGKIKRTIKSDTKYIELVKQHLYKNVHFDFETANTKLLIALASLIVGKKRGNVQNIITYNFDSVLEWYLRTNGLKVSILSKSELLFSTADVYITHIHGYLPHSLQYGNGSDFLIFSDEEFSERMLEENDYWKDHLYEFFRRHIFLSIGLSASSIIDDIGPYLHQLDKWYVRENILRNMPYGFAFVSNDTTKDEEERILELGIIPCKFSHADIPSNIFGIAQKALDSAV